MSVEVRIPEIGESVEEVTIAEWLKKQGDRVEKDETLVVLDSDKASLDLPSPESGILESIEIGQGEQAEIGDLLCRIQPETGGEEHPKPAKTGTAPRAEPSAPRKAGAKETEPPKRAVEAPPKRAVEVPPERAAEGGESTPDEAPDQTRAQSKTAPERAPSIPEIEPTFGDGEHGAEEPEGTSGAGASTAGRTDRNETLVPMSPIRRKIARHLVEAQRQAALLTTFNRIDMSRLQEIRKRHGEEFERKHGVRLGLMSFFVRASVEALKRTPELNAEIRDEKIAYRNYQDIGIAIGSRKGLVVPILRDAQLMSLARIESEILDFARRAEEKQLRIEELEGGTFTISNGGVYGSLLSTPIVNAPQSGVLGLHAIQDEAVVREGRIVIRPMMNVALSYDHRIVDGREAVGFLMMIRNMIEDPAVILLEL